MKSKTGQRFSLAQLSSWGWFCSKDKVLTLQSTNAHGVESGTMALKVPHRLIGQSNYLCDFPIELIFSKPRMRRSISNIERFSRTSSWTQWKFNTRSGNHVTAQLPPKEIWTSLSRFHRGAPGSSVSHWGEESGYHCGGWAYCGGLQLQLHRLSLP